MNAIPDTPMPNAPAHNDSLLEITTRYEQVLASLDKQTDEQGIRHLRDFLKTFPRFARAHNDLAVFLHRTGDRLLALAHHEKAHKLDPANITFRKNLADFYFVALGWVDDCVQIYLDILNDNPFDTDTINSLGAICLNLGEIEAAKQYFEQALQLEPGNADALGILSQLESPARSPATFTAPADSEDSERRGNIPPHRSGTEDYSPACSSLNKVRALHPDDREAHDALKQLIASYPVKEL
jgi:Flp pilus assembly protein TadD